MTLLRDEINLNLNLNFNFSKKWFWKNIFFPGQREWRRLAVPKSSAMLVFSTFCTARLTFFPESCALRSTSDLIQNEKRWKNLIRESKTFETIFDEQLWKKQTFDSISTKIYRKIKILTDFDSIFKILFFSPTPRDGGELSAPPSSEPAPQRLAFPCNWNNFVIENMIFGQNLTFWN